MTPGIVTQSPQDAGEGGGIEGDFSVNGQRPDSNSFYVDGVSVNLNLGLNQQGSAIASTGPSAGSTALGTTQSLVSVDALQEFRVLSSIYSAEYGRIPGGQFTFLTRSGTSSYHGIDRTFLFLSYERLNLTQQVPPGVYFVPSFAVRKEAGLHVNFLDYFLIPTSFNELPGASGQPSGLSST
jgi:hypothetical protein